MVFIRFRSLFGPRFERFPLKESHFRGPKIAKIFRLRRAQKSEFGKVVFINFSLRSEFDQGGFSLGGVIINNTPVLLKMTTWSFKNLLRKAAKSGRATKVTPLS